MNYLYFSTVFSLLPIHADEGGKSTTPHTPPRPKGLLELVPKALDLILVLGITRMLLLLQLARRSLRQRLLLLSRSLRHRFGNRLGRIVIVVASKHILDRCKGPSVFGSLLLWWWRRRARAGWRWRRR